MPTYEYECLDCGHNFEAFQKMSDLPLKECQKCKGKVRRMISSGSGLIFKGSGFFVNDYKKTKNPSHSNKSNPKPKNKDQCSGCEQSGCNQKDNNK
jgi:putative FmdB family regulatory protein